MFNKGKKLLKATAKHSIQSMMQREKAEWPPKCSTIFFQPERPACLALREINLSVDGAVPEQQISTYGKAN